MRALRHAAAFVAVAASLASLVVVPASCAQPPNTDTPTEISERDDTVPGYESYKVIDPVVAKRCATLDCHGQMGRGMRLYSVNGLRLEVDAASGSGVNDNEVRENYYATIAVEPEVTRRVYTDPTNNPAERLTYIRKARGAERHKGGQIMRLGDDTDRCLSSFFEGNVNAPACTSAAVTAPN